MFKSSFTSCLLLTICVIFFCLKTFAQDTSTSAETPSETVVPTPVGLNPDFLESSLLRDNNGNGQFDLVAFGDSITRGRGDFFAAGTDVSTTPRPKANVEAGYPLRIETLVGVGVSDLGVLGERLTGEGLEEFVRDIPSSRPDIIFISGGSNDAIDEVTPNKYSRTVQTMINIARALGSNPMLITIPPTCCNRAGISFFTRFYNLELKRLATINDVALADVDKAFNNTCGSEESCFLLNIPEGLHPNIEGYDIMGETVIAELLQIDLFAADGPMLLETALNLPVGSVKTIPDVLPVAPTPTEPMDGFPEQGSPSS